MTKITWDGKGNRIVKHKCECVVKNREENEEQREWLKRWMCMYHWMQTDYYQNKTGLQKNILQGELLDLITLMPDSQTQEIIDYILALRKARNK